MSYKVFSIVLATLYWNLTRFNLLPLSIDKALDMAGEYNMSQQEKGKKEKGKKSRFPYGWPLPAVQMDRRGKKEKGKLFRRLWTLPETK